MSDFHASVARLYKCIGKIGQGTYGVVSVAENKQTGEYVAIKKISLDDDGCMPSTAVREVSLLTEMRHPNIVMLQEIIPTVRFLHLVFEHMQQDLKHFLDARARY